MADLRVRIDPQLIKEATLAAKDDGFASLVDLVNHVLRLYVKGKIRLAVAVAEELQVDWSPAQGRGMPSGVTRGGVEIPTTIYEERRDADGFIERVAVEVDATTSKCLLEESASPDLSLFEGSPLGPMVARANVSKVLGGVLKLEASMFEKEFHQPQVKWIDSRGDRWDGQLRMLDRLGRRKGEEG